jgi:hypothetical protein
MWHISHRKVPIYFYLESCQECLLQGGICTLPNFEIQGPFWQIVVWKRCRIVSMSDRHPLLSAALYLSKTQSRLFKDWMGRMHSCENKDTHTYPPLMVYRDQGPKPALQGPGVPEGLKGFKYVCLMYVCCGWRMHVNYTTNLIVRFCQITHPALRGPKFPTPQIVLYNNIVKTISFRAFKSSLLCIVIIRYLWLITYLIFKFSPYYTPRFTRTEISHPSDCTLQQHCEDHFIPGIQKFVTVYRYYSLYMAHHYVTASDIYLYYIRARRP